jgi:hypothetical protein
MQESNWNIYILLLFKLSILKIYMWAQIQAHVHTHTHTHMKTHVCMPAHTQTQNTDYSLQVMDAFE